MVDVFRVFKEMKYIVCFTSDEILIIYRKIKITQILSALLQLPVQVKREKTKTRLIEIIYLVYSDNQHL